MIERGLVTREDITSGLERIQPELIRYPALDAEAFERRVRRFLETDR